MAIVDNFFLKIRLHHFLGTISGYVHAKFQKNLMSGYREKLVTNERTDDRTDDGQRLVLKTISS